MKPRHTLHSVLKQLGCFVLVGVMMAGCGESEDELRFETTQTADGPVNGVKRKAVITYFGIPYAAPPVGSLRWKPPAPVMPWTEPLVTLTPDPPLVLGAPEVIPVPKCPQSLPTLDGGDFDLSAFLDFGELGLGPVDEDCLYLNVVTPKNADNSPVMVWIHGGGFVSGEGVQTDAGTAGNRLAATENVVVVSMNFRLGALGFLAHPLLSEESEDGVSGNYGLLDQIAALEWVQANIKAFGGDRNNVTIVGQASGATSVCGLLTTERSAGLFHKAIMQSGSCEVPLPALDEAEGEGEKFFIKLSCDNAADPVQCARDAPWDEVLATGAPDPAEVGTLPVITPLIDLDGKYPVWSPVVDGSLFTEQPSESLDAGDFHLVPILTGFNSEEGRLLAWLIEDEAVGAGIDLTEDNYADYVLHFIGDQADPELIDIALSGPYRAENFPDAGDAYAAAATDFIFRCTGVLQATKVSEFVPTYAYEFRYPDADFILDEVPFLPDLDRSQFDGWDDGAFHTSEIQYLFGAPAKSQRGAFEPGSADAILWETMRGYWARFARTGDPNGADAVQWPLFDIETERFLALDEEVTVATGEIVELCSLFGILLE